MNAIEILLSDARGIYIPRDFVTGFDLSKFDGIDADDATTCENPDHEWYWEAWQSIVDNATFTQDGHVYRLTDEEYEEFFGFARE